MPHCCKTRSSSLRSSRGFFFFEGERKSQCQRRDKTFTHYTADMRKTIISGEESRRRFCLSAFSALCRARDICLVAASTRECRINLYQDKLRMLMRHLWRKGGGPWKTESFHVWDHILSRFWWSLIGCSLTDVCQSTYSRETAEDMDFTYGSRINNVTISIVCIRLEDLHTCYVEDGNTVFVSTS